MFYHFLLLITVPVKIRFVIIIIYLPFISVKILEILFFIEFIFEVSDVCPLTLENLKLNKSFLKVNRFLLNSDFVNFFTTFFFHTIKTFL